MPTDSCGALSFASRALARARHAGGRPGEFAHRSSSPVGEEQPQLTDSRFEVGRKVRTEVLGAEHVARAQAQQTEIDAEFQRFITEVAWGSVWARPDLDRRTRSLVTIAILAALGREELALHLRASRGLGVSPKDIGEVLLHVAIYAGIPAANSAMAMVKSILGDAAPGGGAPSPGDTRKADP